MGFPLCYVLSSVFLLLRLALFPASFCGEDLVCKRVWKTDYRIFATYKNCSKYQAFFSTTFAIHWMQLTYNQTFLLYLLCIPLGLLLAIRYSICITLFLLVLQKSQYNANTQSWLFHANIWPVRHLYTTYISTMYKSTTCKSTKV